MEYLYATDRPDYSDLASGRVFYSLPGHPAFPIRLASEIFQRCLAIRAKQGQAGRLVLYDPCCGTGYLAGVIGFLHRPALQTIIGSDIDSDAAALAGRSLDLLHSTGLQRRMSEITEMVQQFGKESHREAHQSALRMLDRIRAEEDAFPLTVRAFQADAFDRQTLSGLLGAVRADIVLTDIPYGLHSNWLGQNQSNPVDALLKSIRENLSPGGVVALASDKHQKFAHPGYRRVEHFQVGKRMVTLFEPV
jgi:tRNA G10  N-methylase Trm11